MKSQHLNKPPFRACLLAAIVPLVTLMGIHEASAQQFEEIIVTARKRAENLQEVPIAVTALQGDDLLKSGIDSQRQLAMMVPNVSVNVNASFVAPYIRGVGTQYANPGLEPSVATYFNDLYISRPSAGMMSFADIERVEVLKGPQGTLYGRNTTGGAIRVITKAPTHEFQSGIGLSAGNYGKLGVDGYVSGPLSDNVRGRFAAQYEERDGWVDNIAGGPDMDDRELGMVLGTLDWDVSEQLSAKLIVDWTDKSDRESVHFQPLFGTGPEQTGAVFGGISTDEHDEYSGNVQINSSDDYSSNLEAGGGELRLDYEFDSFTLSSITGYRYVKFEGVADLDGTSLPLFNANTVADETESYSQEFQAVSSDVGKLNWIVGMFLYKEEASDNFGLGGMFIETSPGLFPGAFIGGDGDIDVESYAPYGQVSYDITDEWEVLLGLRYTDEKKEVANDFYVAATRDSTIPLKPYAAVVPTPDADFDYQEPTVKLQATWRPSDGVMLYASYSDGLKSGGFNMPSPSPNPVTPVDNETIESYELGWKTQFERIRFNGAIFHYELEDLQLQVTDLGGGITSVRNAGSAEVDGVEADVAFIVTDNFQLDGGIGYQETEFGSVPNGQIMIPCRDASDAVALADATCVQLAAFAGASNGHGPGLATLTGDLKGNELPQAPELTGYVRGSYTYPMGDKGELRFSLLANYTDDFYWTADNNFPERSRWLANADAGWTSSDGRYTLGAFVTNLTDEEFYTHTAPFAGSGGWKVAGQPRMYGGRFAMSF